MKSWEEWYTPKKGPPCVVDPSGPNPKSFKPGLRNPSDVPRAHSKVSLPSRTADSKAARPRSCGRLGSSVSTSEAETLKRWKAICHCLAQKKIRRSRPPSLLHLLFHVWKALCLAQLDDSQDSQPSDYFWQLGRHRTWPYCNCPTLPGARTGTQSRVPAADLVFCCSFCHVQEMKRQRPMCLAARDHP